MQGPLEGLKVLDFTQYVAGPFCTLLLADLGAEVIKVEMPGRGGIYRVQGPHFLKGESVTFLSLNRNKKSLTLNLKHPQAQEVIHRLVREVDVLVENFKPGTADRIGIGYPAMSEINPRLIYCSISGYGQTGPDSQRGGYDLMVQGSGGIMSVTGEPDRPPVKVGVPALDMGAAMYGAFGILAAYVARESTGRGQHVDTSLLDCATSWFTVLAMDYYATGAVPGRMGSASPLYAPYQTFKAQDGYISIIGTGGKDSWERLCRVLGLERLIDDPRFADNASRVAHQEELAEIIESVLVTQKASYWLERLEANGLPCGPINDLSQLLEDRQVRARNLWVEIEHPVAGLLKVIGLPVKLSDTPGSVRTPPPTLGQHTGEVLARLGYSSEEIESLEREGTV